MAFPDTGQNMSPAEIGQCEQAASREQGAGRDSLCRCVQNGSSGLRKRVPRTWLPDSDPGRVTAAHSRRSTCVCTELSPDLIDPLENVATTYQMEEKLGRQCN
ncbi:hypothetical protein [Oryza sativa Japonica Group]|uniref:Uncharacterized protein n=1 Tax=Oryza sativa subsp. japonica TaxID=39947 RepID=Q5NAF9_ORYSJ|nr:hypothetical protein DAI22_01g088516 [Oryza sativa Japonica Group]BAD81504.1 hypothetical protein [Oryza sativa Japonica Group]BAD81547.1 hypothetical protein [Oryza sativa Japonica Group]